MRVRLVLAGALAVLAAGVALVLSSSEPRQAGSNRLPDNQLSVSLPAGATLCQGGEVLPEDTRQIRVTVDDAPGETQPLAVSVDQGPARPLAGGRTEGGYPLGGVAVPLDRTIDGAEGANVCVQNVGDRGISVGGVPAQPEFAATVRGGVQSGRIRLEYLRPGSESWWAVTPAVLDRAGLGKSDVLGSWTLPAVVLLLLAGIAVGVRLLLRGEPA